MNRSSSDNADRDGTAAGTATRNLPTTISNAVSGAGTAIGNLFSGGSSTPASTTSGAGDDEDADPNTPGVQRRSRSAFSWGNTIGGILGVGGAWLASSIFGGGWLGTIMFALFAIPAFMMGRNQLGPMMSGLFGETPRTPANAPAASASGQAQAQNQTPAAPGATVTPQDATVNTGAVAPQLTPQQQVATEISEVAQKTQLARQAVMMQAQSGQMNPRRATGMLRSIGEIERDVQGMQGIDLNQVPLDQLRLIHRRFNSADNNLDRVINSNPILAAQLMQGRAAAAPAAPAAGYNQGYTNMRTSVGVNIELPPQAQMTLDQVRRAAPNYAYGQASEAPSVSPQFSGQQYAAPQRLN